MTLPLAAAAAAVAGNTGSSDSLSNNAFFTAGVSLLVVGCFVTYLNSWFQFLLGLFIQSLHTELKITTADIGAGEIYRSIRRWMVDHPDSILLSQSHRLDSPSSLKASGSGHRQKAQRFGRDSTDHWTPRHPPTLTCTPGHGIHIAKWNGLLILISCSSENLPGSAHGAAAPVESMYIRLPSTPLLRLQLLLGRILGWVSSFFFAAKATPSTAESDQELKSSLMSKSSTQILKAFCDHCTRYNFTRESDCTILYRPEWNTYPLVWDHALTIPKKPLHHVILNRALIDDLLADIRNFFSSADWYRSRGVPFRRSYLLHGPPGCGKTSFVRAVASELSLDICIMSISARNATDETVSRALLAAPAESIILLEDIDAAFPNRPTDKSALNSHALPPKITFSGLLNALDGIASQEGRIVIMTTNCLQEITDPAILRPGRVDRLIRFGYADSYQIEHMYLKFFSPAVTTTPVTPKASDRSTVCNGAADAQYVDLAKEFAKVVPSDKISPALLQGYFIKYRDRPQDAVRNVQELFVEFQEREDLSKPKAE